MKKTITLTFTLLLTIAFASSPTSLASMASQEGEMMMKKKTDKPAKTAAEPKTDADIQKCISDKFAASKVITNGAATVANGEATLTGEAKSGGAKGGATNQAKSCGAKKVTNNMTTPPSAAAKTGEKKKVAP